MPGDFGLLLGEGVILVGVVLARVGAVLLEMAAVPFRLVAALSVSGADVHALIAAAVSATTPVARAERFIESLLSLVAAARCVVFLVRGSSAC